MKISKESYYRKPNLPHWKVFRYRTMFDGPSPSHMRRRRDVKSWCPTLSGNTKGGITKGRISKGRNKERQPDTKGIIKKGIIKKGRITLG